MNIKGIAGAFMVAMSMQLAGCATSQLFTNGGSLGIASPIILDVHPSGLKSAACTKNCAFLQVRTMGMWPTAKVTAEGGDLKTPVALEWNEQDAFEVPIATLLASRNNPLLPASSMTFRIHATDVNGGSTDSAAMSIAPPN